MASSVASEDGDIGFQIAPMVDVVFVLMLFFMACAGSQKSELEMNVNLPAEKGTPALPIVIDIGSDGLVSMNSQNYGTAADTNLNHLRDWLRNALQTFGDKDPIVVRPSPGAKHERIMQ